MTLRVTTHDENDDLPGGCDRDHLFAIIHLPEQGRRVTGACEPVTESEPGASRGTTHCCHRARRADSSSERCPAGTYTTTATTRWGVSASASCPKRAIVGGSVCAMAKNLSLPHLLFSEQTQRTQRRHREKQSQIQNLRFQISVHPLCSLCLCGESHPGHTQWQIAIIRRA